MRAKTSGRVLVVDEDWEALESLAQALRDRGHSVSLATDGRTGLARAAEVAAEVVLVDEGLPVLDLRMFFDVIRDDPRTRTAHLFVMGRGDPARLASLDRRAEPVVKPFHSGEVAARIDDVLREAHAPEDARELRGDLSEVALFDLLQVFAANGRTGRLALLSDELEATVWIGEGDVVDAQVGVVTAEKAVYRALAITEGTFVFTPMLKVGRHRIRASVSGLLMEAARRADEVERLSESLPSWSAQVRRALDSVPEDADGVAVVGLLALPTSVRDLLDHSTMHDLETLRALARLIEEGVVEVLASDVEEVDFASPEEALMLGATVAELRRPGLSGVVRVGVVAENRADLASFTRALAAIRQFRPDAQPPAPAGNAAFGSLGLLSVGAARIELMLLPPDASALPMLAAFMAPARALLALSARAVSKDVITLLGELDLRLVVAAPGWDTPGGAVASLRELFRN